MRKIGPAFDAILVSSLREAHYPIAKHAVAVDGASHHIVVLPSGDAYEVTATRREAEALIEQRAKRLIGIFRKWESDGEPFALSPLAQGYLLDTLEVLTDCLVRHNQQEDEREAELHRQNPLRRRLRKNTTA